MRFCVPGTQAVAGRSSAGASTLARLQGAPVTSSTIAAELGAAAEAIGSYRRGWPPWRAASADREDLRTAIHEASDRSASPSGRFVEPSRSPDRESERLGGGEPVCGFGTFAAAHCVRELCPNVNDGL